MEGVVKNDKINLKNIRFNELYATTDLDGAVKLRYEENSGGGIGAIAPVTITEFFKTSCQRYVTRPALAYKFSQKSNSNFESFDKKWNILSYVEYGEKVQYMAKLLIHIGLKPHESVGILANNCPEWVFLQFGTLNAGGIVFGINPKSSSEEIFHMLNVAQATVCIVENSEQLEKVAKISCRLNILRVILQLHGTNQELNFGSKTYYSWDNVINLGFNEEFSEELEKRESEQFANECAMIVFKSGSFDKPKAVMLSHDNIIYNVKAFYSSQQNLYWDAGRIVSYLPLNHVAAQAFEIFSALLMGACVYFADVNALKGTLVKTLREVRPTMFLGVPKVYVKLEERLKFEQKRKGKLSTYIENTARDAVTLNKFCEANCAVSVTIKDTIANYIIDNTRKVIGMECCKLFFCCGEPLKEITQSFFGEFGVDIIYIHVITELAGPATINPSQDKLKSIGKPIDGTKLEIRKQKAENIQGEILFNGRNVFMGYLNEPLVTEAVIDKNGWLQTSEFGYLDCEGYLFKSKNKKKIITSDGDVTAPEPIERALKKELSALSNAMVVGHNRKYLSVLLTLKTKVEPSIGLPTDYLHTDTRQWLKSLGFHSKKLSDVVKMLKSKDEPQNASRIMRSIAMAIERVNSRMRFKAKKIEKFLLLRHDFSEATGELGPSANIRRKVVLQKYAKKINEMYS